MSTYSLLAWLPADQRKPLLQRLLIVWAVSLPIAVATWMSHSSDGLPPRLEVSLVYAYAISTFIWLFTDVVRFVFKRLLRAQAPFYWPPAVRASLMLLVGVPVGYALGTLVGDAYAGWSTWDLWHFNRNRFAGMVVSTVAISAAFVGFFYQRAKAESLTSQVIQAQLRLLQSQLEPHMLFNTLANVRALIGQDAAQAQAMLDRLIDFLRTTLQASRQSHHSMEHEFDCLADYLALMQMRMGKRLAFTFDLPPELTQRKIPSLLLQPLVENSIRHGLEPKIEGGTIHINAFLKNKHLCLCVQDDGLGFQDHATTHGTSFGLSQIRQRLHTLYGAHAQLSIVSNNNGACVSVQLPNESV